MTPLASPQSQVQSVERGRSSCWFSIRVFVLLHYSFGGFLFGWPVVLNAFIFMNLLQDLCGFECDRG